MSAANYGRAFGRGSDHCVLVPRGKTTEGGREGEEMAFLLDVQLKQRCVSGMQRMCSESMSSSMNLLQ